ncbi:hypothetical protein PPL_07161 [Heterostelium album PN500]|uniref:Uncharacterized protein n=1 Tax=Heterostelium pallidum (strain ATCC 26659 / Pp 5 / PN500) TaxID=670386 RepID=D3BEJ8_HETP5|nr:hypothetical protein PPL_07161 [Heterostelium album PN500]EFA80329.1 hypothetical protein PPL_07161 [Heterostelium album PN500]|eukprot:XP_020432449.1 hypothetical protein PPL_07161 [Heterostelium album PN500]
MKSDSENHKTKRAFSKKKKGNWDLDRKIFDASLASQNSRCPITNVHFSTLSISNFQTSTDRTGDSETFHQSNIRFIPKELNSKTKWYRGLLEELEFLAANLTDMSYNDLDKYYQESDIESSLRKLIHSAGGISRLCDGFNPEVDGDANWSRIKYKYVLYNNSLFGSNINQVENVVV